MNCENTVDVDNLINDIIECSNIRQNGNPDCINRLLLIKEETKGSLKLLGGYFKRLLNEFELQKNTNNTNVSNKIKRINTGIKTLIAFNGATQPGNTRKERIEEVYYAFTEIAKIHKSIGINNFEKFYYGITRYFFKKYGKKLLFLLVTLPVLIWGVVEAYGGLYEKLKDVSHIVFTEKT